MNHRTELFAFSRNTVLRAGAGTGKTEALATLYLHLVGGLADPDVWPKQGVPPERIVALTFTEKAASEMRDRIAEAVGILSFETLPDGLQADDRAVRERVARAWGLSRGLGPAVVNRVLALADSAVMQGRLLPAPEVWQRVGFALGAARIGTFHGFAAGLLRSSALDLELDPAFRVIEQEESDRLLRQSVVEALSRAARRDQRAVSELLAMTAGLDPAGEHGLVARLAGIVRALDDAGHGDKLGVRPVLDAAPVDMSVAVDTLVRFARACETVPSLMGDGTAARAMRLAEEIAALNDLESVERARRCVDLFVTYRLPAPHRTRRIEGIASEARAVCEALRNRCLAVLSLYLAEHARDVIVDARRTFREHKRRNSALDFSDLMNVLRDALQERVHVRRAWKHRFDAILVDEFQDTNRVQRDLLYLLRERRDGERLANDEERRSLTARDLEPSGLFLVGDAKQSIYAFRGADVSVFLETERDIVSAGGVSLELTESYRSLDEVIEAVNPVTEALLGAGLIAHAESMYDRRRDALVALVRGDGRTRMELMQVPGDTAEQVRRAEAEAIARRIRSLVDATEVFPEGWRVPRYDDIAVLVPSWSHVDVLRDALRDHGIPHALLGGPGFWERREVDDLVVLLRFVADPDDKLALASVLRGPLVGLSDAALAKLMSRPSTLDDVLDPPAWLRASLDPDDRERLDEARPTLRRLVRFGSTLGPEGVLRLVLSERAYAAVLATLPFGAQRVANVDKLVGLAAAAQRRGGDDSTLAGFVRYVDRMRAAAQHETDANVSDVAAGAVQVLSVHAAKGLEWPIVFVAQTSRRRRSHAERLVLDAHGRVMALPMGFSAPQDFQDLRRDAHAAEEDDQRRLLYVALTRARDLVVVSGPVDDGEGEWRTLSKALLQQVPMSVLRLAPGEMGPAVPVRAMTEHQETARAEPEVLDSAVDPPRIPRRRMVMDFEALEDFARCPRRYFSLYELGLAEQLHGSGHCTEGLDAALREVLARMDLVRAGTEPEASVAAAVDALGSSVPRAILERARLLAHHVVRSTLGNVITRDGAVMARALPVAVSVGTGDETVVVQGRVDLVLRGSFLDREGVVVVRYVLGSRGTGGPEQDGLVLDGWRLALQRRFREAGISVPEVHTAVAFVHDEGASLRFVRKGCGAGEVERRVLELSRRLGDARMRGWWEGRAREHCDRLGCGFVSRCHGW